MRWDFSKCKYRSAIQRAKPSRHAEALVDTGASITATPGSILDALGVSCSEKRSPGSALGDEVRLDVGDTIIVVDGQRVSTPVVFNFEGTLPLLGAMTLSALSSMLTLTAKGLSMSRDSWAGLPSG